MTKCKVCGFNICMCGRYNCPLNPKCENWTRNHGGCCLLDNETPCPYETIIKVCKCGQSFKQQKDELTCRICTPEKEPLFKESPPEEVINGLKKGKKW